MPLSTDSGELAELRSPGRDARGRLFPIADEVQAATKEELLASTRPGVDSLLTMRDGEEHLDLGRG